MLTIEVDDAALRSYLERLNGRMEDMTPVMESIGQELETRISGRFETESDPDGVAWAPWAASTKKYYPANGNGRILDRYGDMLGSLSWSADSASVSVGFGQPYAAYHEWGTRRMPRRGLLASDPDAGKLGEDDERSVIDVLTAYLTDD